MGISSLLLICAVQELIWSPQGMQKSFYMLIDVTSCKPLKLTMHHIGSLNKIHQSAFITITICLICAIED